MHSIHAKLFQEPCVSQKLWGHEEVFQTLRTHLMQGTLPAVLLLHGPQGIGKTALAYHVAHLLLQPMEKSLYEPSALWRRLNEHTHPDFFLLQSPMNEGNATSAIPIEHVRDALHFMHHHIAEAPHRVLILDAADDLSVAGVNALLKTLEEPQQKTFLILISHNPNRLLPTLRSRCHRIRCQPLGPETVRQSLEDAQVDTPALDFYQAYGAGRLGWIDTLHRYGGLQWAQTWDHPEAIAEHMLTWVEETRKNAGFSRFLITWITWWMRQRLEQASLSERLYVALQHERDILAAFQNLDQLNLDSRQIFLYVFNRLRGFL